MKLIPRVVCALVIGAAGSVPALAHLGGESSSVQSDRVKMKGALRVTSTADYTVHEIESNGTVVREYVSPAGKVFAVSWHGPAIPDLHQVLGDYYAQYQQAVSDPQHTNHRHLAIDTPGFVMQAGGHMRAFSGRAWAPDLMPLKFSVDNIK